MVKMAKNIAFLESENNSQCHQQIAEPEVFE